MSGTVMNKAPADLLDFDVDMERWLTDADALTNATASIADTTATVDHVEFSETSVKVWIAGGADGEVGTVTAVATTAQGRTKEICFRLRIRDCC